jgi:hypothetical protein
MQTGKAQPIEIDLGSVGPEVDARRFDHSGSIGDAQLIGVGLC